MPIPTSIHAEVEAQIKPVACVYVGLQREFHGEDGLGGRLVYAGDLDTKGQDLVRATNIAGGASLSVATDAAMQRQVIREGVVDFLVNSLDEALRILKNEIRKGQAVAVGVTATSQAIVSEMRERGVLPDLLRSDSTTDLAGFVAQGARYASEAAGGDPALVVMPTPPAEFEQLAKASLAPDAFGAQRWIRLAPRYLGPQLRRVRSAVCDRGTAEVLTKALEGISAAGAYHLIPL